MVRHMERPTSASKALCGARLIVGWQYPAGLAGCRKCVNALIKASVTVAVTGDAAYAARATAYLVAVLPTVRGGR